MYSCEGSPQSPLDKHTFPAECQQPEHVKSYKLNTIYTCGSIYRRFTSSVQTLQFKPHIAQSLWRQLVYKRINYTKTECSIKDWLVHIEMIKRAEATQTLRAGCSKARPKIFAPPQTRSRGRRMAKI